jgi:hypothetical protein
MDRRRFLTAAGASAVGAAAPPAWAGGNAAWAGASAATAGTPGDIALLRELLTRMHPGLYRYASPRAIDAGLARLEQRWAALDLAGQFLALARFLATIQCGHSYPNFFNQSAAVKAALFDRPTRLPFTFTWVGDQMVVLDGSISGTELPRGSVIKAINGEPAGALLKKLIPYVRADGGNDGKRRALLSVTGADGLETFDIFHGLIAGTPGAANGGPATGRHRLRFRAPGARRDAWADVPTLSLADRLARVPQKAKSDQPIWDWTMRDDGIAVLRMDSWALYNSKWQWQDWLNDRLDSLSGAKGLIVDIRENEGGNDVGDAILARLANRDIARPPYRRLVRYQSVPDSLRPHISTWDNRFYDWGDSVRRVDDRFFEQVGDDASPVIAAKGPRVAVPMAVLTSAQNSSATFGFAQLCRASGLGTLVGETTGGNQRGINGGGFFFAKLPDSGLSFDLPLVGTFPKGPTPADAGITPDVRVPRTIGDIAAGTDSQLAAAVAALGKQSR